MLFRSNFHEGFARGAVRTGDVRSVGTGWQLDDERRIEGVLHMHDLLRAGVV